MGADGDSSEAPCPSSCDAEGGATEAPAATVNIRCSNGSKFSVQTGLDVTVRAFKVVLAGSCDVPAEQQKLIYKGRILKDDQTLASYGLESEHTIHLVRGAAPSTTPSTTTAASLGASRAPNSTTAAGSGRSLFSGLGVNGFGGSTASGIFGAEFPELDQVQQQLSQNPTIMREIMNLPAMQNLINNPELIRNFVMNNPQMRQILDRNPDLAHVLNDPSTLRQTFEAARNPELMREMMRNTDRAMSNIESSPEGFNMLRRMYETVQEPFLNAATMGGDVGSDLGSNPFAALLGNIGAAQVRDNSQNSLTTSAEPATDSPAPNANPLPNPWNPTTGGAQSINARLNPATDAQSHVIAGLGGLGLPDLERAMSRMQDSSLLSQVMQNPAMMQMMQTLLSDPQYMNQMLNFNPNVHSLLDSNIQLREMLQSPEFLRQLMSPETIQQLLSLQQSLFSQIGRQQSREQNQTVDGTGIPNNTGIDFLMNMFGGLGAGGLGAQNTSNVPPEELYATQLSQLQEMGFFDTQENIRALTATSGNVHAAVEWLLGDPGR